MNGQEADIDLDRRNQTHYYPLSPANLVEGKAGLGNSLANAGNFHTFAPSFGLLIASLGDIRVLDQGGQ